MHSPRQKAFTLIELLVVIAIIALLIGILLPALGRARESAQNLKCTINARSMGTAMELYAADNKNWYPVMPALTNTNVSRYELIGNQNKLGVAGLFSLFQVGQADWDGVSNTPPADLRGYIGGPAQGLRRYPDRSKTPLMDGYMDAYEVLTCPRDKADAHWRYPTNWWDALYYDGGTDFIELVPEVPSGPEGVVDYNISYLYFAGFKADEPGILTSPPLWGDETFGSDMVTNAFYGYGYDWVTETYRNGFEDTADSIGFNGESGYADIDNHGSDGGHFVFTDGHVELIVKNPQRTFFARVTPTVATYDASGNVDGFAQVSEVEQEAGKTEGKSINLVNPNRSSFMQTID